MHVPQLLQQLLLGKNVEVVEPWLPDGIREVDRLGIRAECCPENSLDPNRTTLLPLLDEVTDVIVGRKPDDRMHMVRHDDKADATASLLGQLGSKHAEHDLLCPVAVEKTPPLVAREREKMGVPLGIEDSPTLHLLMVNVPERFRKPLVASRPGQQVVRAMRHQREDSGGSGSSHLKGRNASTTIGSGESFSQTVPEDARSMGEACERSFCP